MSKITNNCLTVYVSFSGHRLIKSLLQGRLQKLFYSQYQVFLFLEYLGTRPVTDKYNFSPESENKVFIELKRGELGIYSPSLLQPDWSEWYSYGTTLKLVGAANFSKKGRAHFIFGLYAHALCHLLKLLLHSLNSSVKCIKWEYLLE